MRTRTAFLMPVYDPHPERLRRTLDSLRNQRVPADIVIVDDGSNPAVETLLEPHPIASRSDAAPSFGFAAHFDDEPEATSSKCALGAHDLTILRLPRNQGIVGALNRGLSFILENGYEYVARMDCGDLCLPDRIAVQQGFMDDRPDLDLLGCHAEIVDEAGRYLFTEGTAGGEPSIRRKLFDNAAFKHPAFFFRTRSLARLGVYSDGYRHAEDYEFARRYAARGRIACLDDVLIVYEKTATGLSDSNRRAQLRSRLRVQLRYFEPATAAASLGVLRTLVTMLVPAGLWARASRLYWLGRKRGPKALPSAGRP